METWKPDPAISILQGLSKGSNPELAQMSGGLMAEAQQFKAATQEPHAADSEAGPRTDRGALVNGSIRIEKSSAAEEGEDTISNQTPPDFLRGTIVSVDCSSLPVPTLAVVSGGKNWKMQVQDSKHILLIGADSFSCSWSKQKVALNYRETGEAEGNVISIELQ